ncbi:STAS/SEC14 domain-containing protein [Microbulbifer taiwanensis]|uniref:STAS/SEC14 domain-containing protein n=1 Tax=Microbulbifer taiwanensis TaxID=986746 RepID=UPI00360E37A4
MSVQRHGVSIGLERTDGEFFLTMHVRGKLTHDDYQSLVPMLESAIEGWRTRRSTSSSTRRRWRAGSRARPGTISSWE